MTEEGRNKINILANEKHCEMAVNGYNKIYYSLSKPFSWPSGGSPCLLTLRLFFFYPRNSRILGPLYFFSNPPFSLFNSPLFVKNFLFNQIARVQKKFYF
jgi:hypothetical protein